MGLLSKVTWAPAAFVQGDKVSFYRCSFISLQDTLTDREGCHYFEQCYFEGEGREWWPVNLSGMILISLVIQMIIWIYIYIYIYIYIT